MFVVSGIKAKLEHTKINQAWGKTTMSHWRLAILELDDKHAENTSTTFHNIQGRPFKVVKSKKNPTDPGTWSSTEDEMIEFGDANDITWFSRGVKFINCHTTPRIAFCLLGVLIPFPPINRLFNMVPIV